jgi:hydrophobe/amphiphile efflux-1 (HAE1) family protein
MRLSDISIKNSVFAWMLFFAFIVFGFISFSRMGISQLPDVDFPVINVALSLSGAAPEVMETTVVDAVEDALSTVEGVQKITSVSKTGIANITIEFELSRNIDSALQEVQTKVAQAQRLLPTNVDPPVISKTNPDDQPILWLALTYEKDDPYFLMSYAKDSLKDRFTIVPGVGEILLGGYTDPALRVWVQPQALNRYHISVSDVLNTIKTQHSEVPGGFIQTPQNAYNVRTMGEAKTVPEFNQLVISSRSGQLTQDPTNMVRIGQVARVEEGLAEVYRISRFEGKTALGLGIKKQLGSNAVAVARAVKEQMKIVQQTLPPGMKLQINFDSSRYIEQSVSEMVKHLMMAVLLTSFVCWIFLGSWTATLNVLLAIPTSIMGAFVGLYFFGFTLNTFTLLGLTLAIGIVVDDAIMVLENIFRYNEKGLGRIESAIVGAREITFAAIAATLAIIAIFLPVAFMQGVIGKFFLQYGVTISLAVSLSLLESLTITPMRCSSFVHTSERSTFIGRGFDQMIERGRILYGKSLAWVLNHHWSVFIGSLVFVAVSFYTVSFLNRELTPVQDQSLFIMRLRTPIGSSLKFTDTRALEVEKWLAQRSEISHYYVAVGGGGGAGGSDTNAGFMFITMKDRGERGIDKASGHELSQQEFMSVARKELSKISDLKIFMQDLSGRGFSTGRGFPIEFVLQGPDWEKLAELNDKFKKSMMDSGLMIDVDSDYLEGMPEIQIVPDRIQAALHGVSIEAIGNTVNALIGGVKNGQYTKNGRRYDIYVQLEKDVDPRKEIRRLVIGNDRANLIPISRLTKIEQKNSLQQISRTNRQRAVTLYANLAPGASQQTALEFIKSKAQELPPTYFVTDSGASKTFKESFQSLLLAFALGIFVAYMVLASQFNSFLDPIAVLMALPFSFSGAFFALLLTHQTLNMYSLIGLLLLMGIVKKNSILLIDFTNTVRFRDKKNAVEALLVACPIRLRPIIMTSFATIAAAIPSALAKGAGSETFRPMAITLIGGVFVSTLLTLYVVPITYVLLERFRKQDIRKDEVKEAFDHAGQTALER